MIEDVFLRGLPRVTLTIPGVQEDIEVGCIVDTGFDGDLALPARIALRLGITPTSQVNHLLANGTGIPVPILEVELPWGEDEEPRLTTIAVMEGNALIGTELLRDCLLQIELTEGGSVTAEPL